MPIMNMDRWDEPDAPKPLPPMPYKLYLSELTLVITTLEDLTMSATRYPPDAPAWLSQLDQADLVSAHDRLIRVINYLAKQNDK